jgi:hypothetical protein
MLSKRGLLFVATVPNVSSVASICHPEGFIAKNFPDAQHHFHYSPQTLIRLGEAAGLRCVHLEGETRDSVEGRIAATAAWLANSCGVPRELCAKEKTMVHLLRERLIEARERLHESHPGQALFAIPEFMAGTDEEVVDFWRREIWPSPYFSDEFDVWFAASDGVRSGTPAPGELPSID